uniref:Uncharacterized protein n=1 Tax=Cucumis melo TaxID=3656 RepID=A0A9I9EF54_CUCME
KKKEEKNEGSVRAIPTGTQVGSDRHGPLSFHCMEREVVVALSSQPHAFPPALEAHGTWASAQAPWLSSMLEMGGPEQSTPNPAQQDETSRSINLMPPLGS